MQKTPGVQKKAEKSGYDFFARMGKPLSMQARQAGYNQCLAMGLDKEMAFRATAAVADSLERDQPYEAQAKGMQFLDCTGMYRLMATLLAT